MNVLLSYFSGIVAAFTPCVIVLMPILLYRFFNVNSKKKWFEFGVFTFSFLFSYIIFGFFLSALFTSKFQNGIRVGIGLLFVILGILGILNKLNPIKFPLLKSNLGLGFMFSLIISFNPCTLPFLSLIISMNTSILIIINLFFFALGIITPSIFFSYLGNKILLITTKLGRKMFYIEKLMNFVLLLSGIYLVFSIERLTKFDIYLISFFILFIFYILIKVFFIINKKSDFKNIGNILILISLGLILFTALFHCNSIINFNNSNSIIKILQEGNYESNIYTCGGNITKCEICQKCIYLFFGSVFIGFVGLFLVNKFRFNN